MPWVEGSIPYMAPTGPVSHTVHLLENANTPEKPFFAFAISFKAHGANLLDKNEDTLGGQVSPCLSLQDF